jgi:maltooligosyltrehalose trehalohydrolase
MLKVNTDSLAMQGPDPRGWWRLDVPAAGDGTDYAYCIDGDSTPYPDPRSLSQPNGVHGMSRVYGHDSFEWSDADFRAPGLPSGVVYELHIGTFTTDGTLDAAIDRLDYLADLGVTHVELMPVSSFDGGRGWGYDGVALFAVQESYGGPDALKRFVNAAHEKGLAVLLDVVYNHFGPVGNYTGQFGPYVVDSHRTPWGGAVNLEDAGSHEVRRFFCDNALMWLRDFHVDGLRLDAVHAFVDRSAIHFLEQLAVEVEDLGNQLSRKLVLIAESDLNDPRVVTSRELGGLGMEAQWSDDFHHALFSVLNGAPNEGYYADFGKLSQLAKAVEHTFVYDGIFSEFRDRIHGRPAEGLTQDRFLGFIQNHDQVGNRALGDRICETVGFARAKIAAAVVLMSPFVPLLFQGEEWAASSPFQYFVDYDDPEMAQSVSIGRKKEFKAFGWNPDSIPEPGARSTFENSKLNWSEAGEGAHAEMLRWYRNLIRLRKVALQFDTTHDRQTHVHFSEHDKWFTMKHGAITLACNLGLNARILEVPEANRLLLTSQEGNNLVDGSISLAPDSVAILE